MQHLTTRCYPAVVSLLGLALLLDNSALLELQRVQATEVQAANLLGRAELHHCSDVVLFLPESNTSAEVDFSLRSSACTDIKVRQSQSHKM